MTDTTPKQPNRIYRVRGLGIGECEVTVNAQGDILDRPMPLRRWKHMRELSEYALRQRWVISFRRYEVEEEPRPVKVVEAREVKGFNS